MDQPLTGAQVVDLLRYRQDRTRPADSRAPPGDDHAVPPATEKQVEHRARMLRFLWEVKSQKSKVKSTDSTEQRVSGRRDACSTSDPRAALFPYF